MLLVAFNVGHDFSYVSVVVSSVDFIVANAANSRTSLWNISFVHRIYPLLYADVLPMAKSSLAAKARRLSQVATVGSPLSSMERRSLRISMSVRISIKRMGTTVGWKRLRKKSLRYLL